MDTFFRESSTPKKRRVHFHAFLQEVHQRIHALKQQDLREKGRSFHVDTSMTNNPIIRVARQLASEVSLLCFDEFQVTDVADALILSQLFATLFEHGTVVVATSNRPPTDLYEGGINRNYFLPFIGLLCRHCIVHELKSSLDYRMLLSDKMDDLFFVDQDPDFVTSSRQIDDTFDKLLDGIGAVHLDLPVAFSRSLPVQQAHPEGLVGRFTFEELCQRDLGSAEYRGLAQYFRIVILERIPLLTLKEHDQARRFITLIDELYENKCALICSAVEDPQNLFVGRSDSDQVKPDPESMETKVGEAFGIDVAQSSGRTLGELASIRELSFAFRRAASRLMEMCSQRWWDQILLLDESDKQEDSTSVEV
jgi:protein AFG1